MKKVYWLYRYFFTEKGNRYSPTFYLGKQFEDLARARIIALADNLIPENKYTWEIATWIITMRRFIDCSYDETKLDLVDFTAIVDNVSSMNDIVMFETVEKARQWVRDNCNLTEVETGKFETYPAWVDEMTWEDTPAKYLIID